MRRNGLMRVSAATIFIVLVAMSCAGVARARTGARGAQQAAAPAHFGVVNFPISCDPGVQQKFDTAVAMLDSFQYQQAEQAFQNIAQQDPGCQMAYWGEAMSLYHQLWDWPSDATMAEGRADIQKAFQPAAKTERERDYVRAAAIFFQDNPSLTREQRVHAYSGVMGKLFAQFSDDVNAGAFYALSLVALPTENRADELANREQAIDILNKLMSVAPRNPGVLHYLIHAADTPELAQEGLVAARRYAKIAPDSSHALHMPSHIFVRLGLWSECIQSNLASEAAAAQATLAGQADPSYQFHAMDFLDYCYLQSGQSAEAQGVYDQLKDVPGANAESIASNQAEHAARDSMENHDWEAAAALQIPDVPADEQESTLLAQGIGAARTGDIAGAQADLGKMSGPAPGMPADAKKQAYGAAAPGGIHEQELRAWILYAQGKFDDAVKTMRAAAVQQEASGFDSLEIPAREMLGDLLMELHRPTEALAEYQAALKLSPKRFDSLDGAARAAEEAGKTAEARQFYSELVASCGPGADRPELQEAKVYLARR